MATPFDAFHGLAPVTQALLAGLFTWGMTALGASLILVRRNVSRRTLDVLLGFSAGVMVAASVWSLILPAIELSRDGPLPEWAPAAVGFLLGGAFLAGVDKILPHLHLFQPRSESEGIETSWHRSTLLVLAITLHNIPEGLAVGVAFGAAALHAPGASAAAAVALALGIGLQNFPEGLAVAAPLRREGVSARKSFLYGQASGMVEPVAAVAGAAFVILAQPVLPYALAFAAGAMIFVVVEELVPESQSAGNTDLATLGTLVGFVVMMVLDVALG